MVEIIYKILSFLISPVTWFWENIPKYVKKRQYVKVAINFLLALLLMAMIAFDILALAYIIIMFANNHMGLVCLISAIGILFWQVKVRSANTEQAPPPITAEETEEQQLKVYARNGYRDMRLIVFKTVQAIGEALDMKAVRMLSDIESVDKYYINRGCIFYIFDIKKENINQKYTEAELEDAKNVLESTFMELRDKEAFPTVQMSTYTDNDGVILPPVIFVLLSDMGSYFELYTAFVSPASVEFIKSAKQGQNSTNTGYDQDDSRLL